MVTYRQTQEWIKEKYGFTEKTCLIAHSKEICGLNPRIASNRYDATTRLNPCPDDKLPAIREAFKHFDMI